VVHLETLAIEVPSETLLALDLSPEEMAAELRLAAAMKLYELGRLSSGAAAALAGIPRTLFLTKLGDYGIDTFSQTDDELETERGNA
jgi:predicted HTH domain antitoxin